MKLALLFALYYTLINSNGAFCFSADQIQSLPGLAPNLSFAQYSGYLDGGQDIRLHYWLVESQANPLTDPIILWLNGGPGASSLWGMLTENGPFRVTVDAMNTTTLTPNAHSWNTLANVLYLESPVGVGFSYSDDNATSNDDSDQQPFNITDETTARSNYLALEDFFAKFPHLRSNPFYITGESYAGIYIPMLALEILRANSTINFKGLAIGNGALNSGSKEIELYMYLSRGLISIDAHNLFSGQFCGCDGHKYQCSDPVPSVQSENEFGLPFNYDMLTNEFNTLSDCDLYMVDDDDNENVSSSGSNCPSDTSSLYLNIPQVRTALHIPDHLPRWKRHTKISYLQISEQLKDMRPSVRELIEEHNMTNIIVYSGKLDMTRQTNFIANQEFVDSLGYAVKDIYHPWYVNGRIGGFVKRYQGIKFTTVRGAGHMVSTDQPEAALEVIKELIGLKQLK